VSRSLTDTAAVATAAATAASASGNCSSSGFHQREHIAATASASPSTNVACV